MFQNEKCHLLIEHETQKLKELDEEHSLELKEWREKLRPRKKVAITAGRINMNLVPTPFIFSEFVIRVLSVYINTCKY